MQRSPILLRVPAARLRRWGVIAGGVAIVAAVSAVTGWLHGADAGVVGEFSSAPDMFEPVAEIVMAFGTIVALIVLLPLAYLRFSSVVPAVELFAALAAARTIGQSLKHAFGTGRPAIADGITIREAADGFGFPSVHATIAFAMASVWCARGDRRDRFVAIPLAFGVGLGRWYVGAHFVVDVVGGAALGVVVGVLTRLIADQLTARR